jgi:hypothetical protein
VRTPHRPANWRRLAGIRQLDLQTTEYLWYLRPMPIWIGLIALVIALPGCCNALVGLYDRFFAKAGAKPLSPIIKPGFGLTLFNVIGLALLGAIIVTWIYPPQVPVVWTATPQPPPSSTAPVYMTNLSVGFSNREADPIVAVGMYTITTERLRVFVDYSTNFFDNQPTPPTGRTPIATVADPVKGRDTEIALVRKEHVQGIGDYWWGDPTSRRPFPGENHGPFYTVFSRLVIVGPDNGEQHYCFRIAWLMDVPKRQFYVSQSDIADWKKGWDCQNDH